jgi:hypothetical protein
MTKPERDEFIELMDFFEGWLTAGHYTLTRQDGLGFAREILSSPWLRKRDAEMKAHGWDVALSRLVHDDGCPVEIVPVDNPYRDEVTDV